MTRSDLMLEEYILSRLPVPDAKLFRRLRRWPYEEWIKALHQLFRDGAIAYEGSRFVAGDGEKHTGSVPGLGQIW